MSRNALTAQAEWNGARTRAPHRASIGRDANWDVIRPPPDLADAMKVCRGGRVLLAFAVASVRDYFVEGHRDQGAQAEPDGVEQPASRRPSPRPASPPASLEAAIEGFRSRQAAYDGALKAVDDAFEPEIDRLIAEGRMRDAAGLVASLPDLALKTMSLLKLKDAGYDLREVPFHAGSRTPLTHERGAALAEWVRTRDACVEAEARMGAFLAPLVEDLKERGDGDGLADLVARTPPCMRRSSMAWTLRQMDKALVETPGGPAP